MMASERKNNKKFHNWVKTSLSLLYLKEGIVDEINEQADNLHANIKQLVETKCPYAVNNTCKSCTSNSIKKSKKITTAGSHWYANCTSNVCNHWLDALLKFHEHLPSPKTEWVNCNPKLWPSQPWEVAKVFQPYGCEHHRNAADSDVAALLTFMLDCKYFNNVLSNKQILREIKECRNRTMHSANLELEDADMLKWHNDMIALLEDQKRLGQLPFCQAAADKIRELRDKPIELSFPKEDENTALSLQISTLTAEVSSIQLSSDTLRCELSEVSKNCQSSSEECERVRQDLSSTGKNVSQLKEEIEMMQGTLGDLDVPQVKDKLSVLQQHLQSLSEQNEEDIRKLSDRIGDVGREMETMKSEMLDEMGAMKEELSGVQHQLKSHGKDIVSLKKEHDGEKKIDTEHVQQHLISRYNKHCQRVPIYPLRPEWRKRVADLFVLPSMVVMNPSGIRFFQTPDQQSLVSHGEHKETKVENIKDIFYSGDKLCKDVYLMGDSGSGKSTLCEYLVHLWANSHSKHDQKSEEERFMEVFTFLFYISLREANTHSTELCDVETIIKSLLKLDNVKVSKLLSDHACLIILDGLDEFSQSKVSRGTSFGSPNLPQINCSDKCTVLITSRPWKLELLAIELEGKIERMVSLTGLEQESQRELVGKIANLLNLAYSRDENVECFFDEIGRQNLDKFLRVPILLTQMLGLWFSGESIGSSQCSIYSKLIEKQLQFTKEVRGIPIELQTEDDNSHSQTKSAHHDLKQQTKSKKAGQDRLPTCFTDKIYCQMYKSLLLRLSRLAYESLFGENKEHSLVFDHEQMEICGMSSDDIHKSLHMGLLTQYKVFGEITQRLKSVSFIHKSHQEFFAAIFLSQTARSSSLKKTLKDTFSDLDRALDMEKVFTFVSGLNKNVSRQIAKVIMKNTSRDLRLQQYRQSCRYGNAPYDALVKRLQGLILAGIDEGNKNGIKITPLQLRDLWMDIEDQDFLPDRISVYTQLLDLSHVRSIFIHSRVDTPRDSVWRLIEATLPNLLKLVLFDCDTSVDMIQKIVRRNPGLLQALGLYYWEMASIDFSRLGQNDLKKILSAPKSSLGLAGVIFTHAQLEFLYRHLSKRSYDEVRLGMFKCTIHGDCTGDCKQRLDLSASKNITRLQLVRLSVQEVVFNPEHLLECGISHLPESVTANMICCLKNAVKLEKIWCWGFRDSAVVELGRILPCLLNLKIIVLHDINLSGYQEDLLTPNMRALEQLVLYKVSLTAGDFKGLLSTIPSHRVSVVLGHSRWGPVTITSYKRTNDIVQQIRDNLHVDVIEDDVEYGDDKCILKQFWFYTEK